MAQENAEGFKTELEKIKKLREVLDEQKKEFDRLVSASAIMPEPNSEEFRAGLVQLDKLREVLEGQKEQFDILISASESAVHALETKDKEENYLEREKYSDVLQKYAEVMKNYKFIREQTLELEATVQQNVDIDNEERRLEKEIKEEIPDLTKKESEE